MCTCSAICLTVVIMSVCLVMSCNDHGFINAVFNCLFSGSVQHVDIAALLIKFNTCVNATDKWAFTPLHEAAQKGRTQLCALLLAHGANPTMKNQEGQTALDLATVNNHTNTAR